MSLGRGNGGRGHVARVVRGRCALGASLRLRLRLGLGLLGDDRVLVLQLLVKHARARRDRLLLVRVVRPHGHRCLGIGYGSRVKEKGD